MDLLWTVMILGGIVYAAFSGNLGAVTDALLTAARDGVQLGIGMAGVMAFWMGLMEIATQCGMMQAMNRKMRRLIHFMFPDIPDGHRAGEYISMNMIANMLGLGGAATPAGLEAMKALEELEEDRRHRKYAKKAVPKGTASKEMCTFLIINISSLQLIPVNMIALRSQYGSSNPAAIAGPALLATACSTLTAIIYCKMKDKRPG